MSNAQPEPSMEEILASIRRIISEDGEEEGASRAKEASKTPRGPIEPPPPIATPPAAAASKAEPVRNEDRGYGDKKELQLMPTNAAQPAHDDDDIIAETTAKAASQAFQTLSQSVRVSAGEGRTLEDIVTELLRPLVKEWLDANLPAIVEEKVEDEVQRLARRRR
ncbi:MAG: DUF2497 domain-containing protein [Alphaproteobacteria bacterium]|nr:DUF2497 domain-containing protein [Alphaproteobacteria bacterium]